MFPSISYGVMTSSYDGRMSLICKKLGIEVDDAVLTSPSEAIPHAMRVR